MNRWRYLTFNMQYDRSARAYVADVDEQHLVGLNAILNHVGEAGWELVNLVAVHAKQATSDWEVDEYRGVFKAPAEESVASP